MAAAADMTVVQYSTVWYSTTQHSLSSGAAAAIRSSSGGEREDEVNNYRNLKGDLKRVEGRGRSRFI